MENTEMNYLLSSTCSMMTEGEALQLSHTSNLDLTEALYLKIIEYKTASLFSASCKLGGIISQVSPEEKEALSSFGRNLGIAFQIADDTLDYLANHKRLGKAIGQDIQEGKMTLPLIHLFLNCQEKEKEKLITLIESRTSKKNFAVVLKLMEQYGSISYAQNRAAAFVQKAKETLCLFEDSAHRQALLTIADYIISRDH
jgi:octaprenyl-diphosphate synthase